MLRWLLWLVLLPLSLPIAVWRALSERLWPGTLLQIQLQGSLPDTRSGLSVRGGPSLLTLVRALEHAAEDPKVRAVHVHLEQAQFGLGQAEELRAALHKLKGRGKQVLLRAEALGLAGYWVALGASEVVLCPTGSLEVTGVASEFTLLRGLLDRVGVRARMVARGRYKSMRETFTETEISPENREMLSSMVTELYELLVQRVAQSRGLSVQQTKEHIDEGPFRAQEALRLGLVDELAYPDQVERRVRDDASLRPLSAEAYLRRKERSFFPKRPPLIAVLEVRGTIGTGKDGVGLSGGRTTGATNFVEQVRRATENPRIKALLLRVNSPGGSALGSDLMWRSLCLAAEKKPIAVSMGDVAASGGYYVSGIAGVPILANPTTVTGSIGVVAGKWEADGLLRKLGVRRELVRAGRHAGYYSPTVNWGPEQEAKLARDVDALYDDFVRKMATARGKEFDAFEPLAQGRVWTGSQAVRNGLVDRAGGLSEAIVHLRHALGVGASARVGFVTPASKPAWRALLGRIAGAAHAIRSGLARVSGEWTPLDGDVHGASSAERMRVVLPFDIRFK